MIFNVSLTTLDIVTIGSYVETHCLFPNRTNVEFVDVLNPNHAVVRVWERGVGKTLACGTGACAAVVAGITAGKCESNVTVSLPGGALVIQFQAADQHLIKT